MIRIAISAPPTTPLPRLLLTRPVPIEGFFRRPNELLHRVHFCFGGVLSPKRANAFKRASADPEISEPIWAWSPGGISLASSTTSAAYRNAVTGGCEPAVRGHQRHADAL
jgi:hypothetical protein